MRATLRRGEWSIRVLREYGINIPRRSRLPNAVTMLREFNEGRSGLTPSLSSDEVVSVSNSVKTLWEFWIISVAMLLRRKRTNTPFCKNSLNLAVLGADKEHVDSNPKARNTQFELFVAALLVLGGAEVISGEPDLRLLYWGRHVGIAAKRVRSTSHDQIEKRILEGARQLGKNRLEGFVAINIESGLKSLEAESEALFGGCFDVSRGRDRASERILESRFLCSSGAELEAATS